MNIELPEDLANWLADRMGIYGSCKSDGDDGCKYDKHEPFCCRMGFCGALEERIREAAEIEKKWLESQEKNQ